MKCVFVLVALVAAAHAAHPTYESLVAKVNHPSSGAKWTAEVPTRFETVEQAKQLCGTWQKGHPNYVRLPEQKVEVAVDLPTAFDSRTAWKNCTVISKVRDQSSCGSCWAFGSTEAFEDRRCVATGEDVEFSTEDTASCCKGFACGLSMGCGGGQPSAALSWMTNVGVVTGGDYPDIGKGTTCRPYTLAPCAHHVPATKTYPKCPSSEYSTPKCNKACSESKYSKTYSDDKTKGDRAFSVGSAAEMQSDIMKNGPLAVAFTVYADFPTYKSGVYHHVSGGMLGGHAVEMIGWGVEAGTPYWWIKNSWNNEWGDAGYFKIARGTDECGIEDDVTAVTF